MDTDKSNSQSQSERDKINEQLDELRKKQQERNAKKKPRSRWGLLIPTNAIVKNAIFAAGLILFRPAYCANTIVSKRFCRIRNFGV